MSCEPLLGEGEGVMEIGGGGNLVVIKEHV